MKMKITLDPGAIMPTRAHDTDAGLDLYSPVDATLYPAEALAALGGIGYGGTIASSVCIDTGVCM